jgi:GTPase SAR1 family protein
MAVEPENVHQLLSEFGISCAAPTDAIRPILNSSCSGRNANTWEMSRSSSWVQTVGMEMTMAAFEVESSKTVVQLQLLDCGGHLCQSSIAEQSIGKGHNFCCLVYSVTDQESFAAIKHWHAILTAKRSSREIKLAGVLVANKIDLHESRRQVRMHVEC